MTWDSIATRTVFDCLIILALIYSIFIAIRNYQSTKRLGFTFLTGFILTGLIIISLVYIADLFTMFVLPMLTSSNLALQVMANLQLSWNKLGVLVAVGVLVGCLHLLQSLISKTTGAMDDLAISREELVRIERMQARVDMVTGLNHNLNNLLNGFVGPAELLLASDLSDDSRRWAEIILSTALRASDLMKGLNDAIHLSEEPQQAVDVNAHIRLSTSAVQTLWRQKHPDANFEHKVVTKLRSIPRAAANPTELDHALNSLILNAFEAMPSGGVMKLATRKLNPGIEIQVQDDGVGMSDEARMRVFEPFFTTHPETGAGLNLYKAFTTIESRGGKLEVENAPVQGTIFRIWLPKWDTAMNLS